jgi:hypothetical protein
MLWPRFVLCAFVSPRMGDTGAQIRVERGLGGIVAVTPSLWRYGRRCGEMTGVMLGQSVVPAFLLTVHDHVRPIGGSGCRGEGPRGSLSGLRAPCVPRVRQKYAKGIGCSHAFVAKVGRGESHSRQGVGVGRF